jgi:hypothetical protein
MFGHVSIYGYIWGYIEYQPPYLGTPGEAMSPAFRRLLYSSADKNPQQLDPKSDDTPLHDRISGDVGEGLIRYFHCVPNYSLGLPLSRTGALYFYAHSG